jgi:signal transduction histidine kinase
MTQTDFLVPALLAAVAVVAFLVLAFRLAACQRGRAAAEEQLRILMTTETSAVRQLRLGSHNLRTIGMTLQGHAEQLEAGGAPDIAGIANSATGVFDIADYMQEWIQHAQPVNVLEEEDLHIGNALDEAISTVSLKMQPGRRAWNVDPDVVALQLRADRRGLRHVLTRALSVSVRSSGHDDGIHVRMESAKGALVLVIEPQPGQTGHARSNVNGSGPDLRLTLARELMEAHGGNFEVDSDEAGSTRIRITFPATRVVKWSDGTPEIPAPGIAAGAIKEPARDAVAV